MVAPKNAPEVPAAAGRVPEPALRGRELRSALLARIGSLSHDAPKTEQWLDLDEALRSAADLDADALLGTLETLADERDR